MSISNPIEQIEYPESDGRPIAEQAQQLAEQAQQLAEQERVKREAVEQVNRELLAEIERLRRNRS